MASSDLLKMVEGALRGYLYSFTREEDLQEGVAYVLGINGFEADREVDLGDAGRVDLFLRSHGIAIEVKIDGSALDVARQVTRYARAEGVNHVVLVTSKPHHGLYLQDAERVSIVGTWGALG